MRAGYNQGYNQGFTATFVNPDKKAPIDIVNKLFLAASSGNYFKIFTMIKQERSLLNLVDTQNRTILHIILMNQDLSKNDKYNLIKALIDFSAPVDIPDFNGIRPLHMAAGQQNREVVKLLIEKKAEVNSKTTTNYTPLHFAVTPESTECRILKKSQLIPDTNHVRQEFRTEKLFDEVYKIFQNNEDILKIQNIFENRYVYPDENADKAELAKFANKIISEKGKKLNKNQLTNDIVDLRKSIADTTRGSLAKTYSKIDIKENTKNGWGPDENGNPEYAILPFENINILWQNEYTPIQQSYELTKKKLMAQIQEIQSYVEEMKKYLEDVNNLFYCVDIIYNVLHKGFIEIGNYFPNVIAVRRELHNLRYHCMVNGDDIRIPELNIYNPENLDFSPNFKINYDNDTLIHQVSTTDCDSKRKAFVVKYYKLKKC